MDKRILQTYAVWAKSNLEQQIEISLKMIGINSDTDIKTSKVMGDFTVIEGDDNSYPKNLQWNREQLIGRVKSDGYSQVIEEFAYTWFNRLIALRFMEVHDFIPHGFRVLSSRDGGIEPEILKNLNYIKDELKLDMTLCGSLKEQSKIEELFRYVLFRQCNALSNILPMLFSDDSSYMELLLPKSLLKGDTVLTKLIEIPEENFLNDIEVIGWLYQFYISVKKDEVFAAKKTITKDTLPAVTQLFTPDWIVRYMAENSVGRIWLESYPQSGLKQEMKYYVEDAPQIEEVQKKIDEIKYKNVNPEDITVIEPCCGSGHILVYVFDLLCKMYEEKGYQKRDIPTLILSKNLIGLDVDKRASQLAAFALVMKARSVNGKFFESNYYIKPQVYEIWDSRMLFNLDYKRQLEELKILSNEELSTVEYLAEIFRDAKTIGSLTKVKELDYVAIDAAITRLKEQAVINVFNSKLMTDGIKLIEKLVCQAKLLSSKYDVMITNPPYVGISTMDAIVKSYAVALYPNSKTDMFAMFMEADFVKINGYLAMINMHSWMFLSSYEKLRSSILKTKEIITMAHLGARAFESIGGEVVQTTSFVMRNVCLSGNGSYHRLVDFNGQEDKCIAFIDANQNKQNGYFFTTNADNFSKIPGSPIAYWVSERVLYAYKVGQPLSPVANPCVGLQTGDNGKFVRQWYEVTNKNFFINCGTREESINSNKKWFPYNKGGEFRKWYGNNDCVVNWKNDGAEIRNFFGDNGRLSSRPQNMEYYFKESISWSKISSGTIAFRYKPIGNVFDVAGTSIFFNSEKILLYLLGLNNSKVIMNILKAISPTLNYEVGQIASLPIIINKEIKPQIDALAQQNIDLSKTDWDSFETSWDFAKHPLVSKRENDISLAFAKWHDECTGRFNTLKANEEELNRIFIDIYGLQDELSAEVADKDVTVRLANKTRDVKSLVSYLIGVAFGRYSLDCSGLSYAGGEWDSSKYRTYKPDGDGIVPIYSQLGMTDGMTARIIELIKLIYGQDTYRANIEFVAEALGKRQNEAAEETLNRYICDDFYVDHLKMYQKRPIYWMFSSGKNNGFKCLIYIHRYSTDTLAKVNGKYFLPESTRLKNELDDMVRSIASNDNRDKFRQEKERAQIANTYNEAIEYGQILDHMANRYLEIDLDDGVKVNYEKFQNVEVVSDGGSKVKRNLLVPVK